MIDKQNKKFRKIMLSTAIVLLLTGVLLFTFLPDYLYPEESQQKILLLEYNDAAHKEMLSVYGFHSKNGKADIQKQSGPVKANVCNMDDRYMYYLEPGGTLVSVTYSERKELGFSGFDNGVKNIVFSDPHKGIMKILEIKHPLLSAHSCLTKQPMSVPFWQVYAGPYKDDLLIFSGKLSTYADNSDRALYTNFREIYESDFTPYNDYDSLITDNSFNPFNFGDNGVSFMCSSISPYTQKLFANHCAFLDGMEYSKAEEKRFQELIVKGGDCDPQIHKLLGWQIFISESLSNRKRITSEKNIKHAVSCYPPGLPEKIQGRYILKIPHKVWSPDGKCILFAGNCEKPFETGVFVLWFDSGKQYKIQGIRGDNTFNPELDWTADGLVITCPDSIWFGKTPESVKKLKVSGGLYDMHCGKLSPDGKNIAFLATKNNLLSLYSLNIKKQQISELVQLKTPYRNNLFAWVLNGRKTIIVNEMDYCFVPSNEPSRETSPDIVSSAASEGRNSLMKILVKEKYNVNILDEWGQSPLHHALFLNNQEMVDLLIKNGAEINIKNYSDYTPLEETVIRGKPVNPEIMKELLKAGADLNRKNCNTVYILKNRWYIFEKYAEGLQKREHNEPDFVKLFSDSGLTILHLLNYCEIWRPTEFVKSPGDLQKQIEPNMQNVNLMVKLGANVNAVTAKGMTPLHYAALTDNHLYASCLIKNGADKNIKNSDGETPLDIAGKFRSKKVLRILDPKH